MPTLLKSKNKFINSKSVILDNWVSYDSAKYILSAHKIKSSYFIKKYANGVFDYFMGVISGETKIGNCPIMQELLTYLKVREISADELFEICSCFRRSMVDFAYIAKIDSKELFEELLYIFDQNFRGILKFYTDTIFQKLIDARAEAINAGEAKEYFLSNMSHEIRTPLNAILGFVNLLINDDVSKKHRDYLTIISSSGENLLSIINDILDFSKLRSGEFTIEAKIFSPYEELFSVVELFLASAKNKNILIKIDIDKKIPTELYGDILRIKQIVSNLLSNAIKFTQDNGKVEVNILYENDILHVRVKDNGIGISKDEMKQIFNPFVQVNHYKVHKSSGTGLGLSISHQLVKLMNGNIKSKSILGKGSEFYLQVPLQVHDKKPYDSEKNKLQINHKIINTSFIGHVLIAEDNEANQELIKILLAKYGISFDLAKNGLEALELYKLNKYDLILMDEQMPIMNGNEAVKKILKYEKLKSLLHTPISALTANVIKGDKERGLLSGFDAFLGKPINIKDLERIFLTYLKVDSSKKLNKNGKLKINFKIEGVDTISLTKELMLSHEELTMLLDLFIKKMKKQLPELQNAIKIRDYHKIALAAHNIKGSSGNFRIKLLQTYASKMEKMAKSRNIKYDYEDCFKKIKDRINKIVIFET